MRMKQDQMDWLYRHSRGGDVTLKKLSRTVCVNCSRIIISVALLMCAVQLPMTSAKFCTKLQVEKRRNTSEIFVPCVQAFHETCGWNIFKYCTYYRQVMCSKQLNFTYDWYYAIQVCCPGYYATSDGSCVEIEAIAQRKKTRERVRLSAGAYAGIAAGGVLLLCVVGIVIFILHRRNRKKMQNPPVEVELEQRVGLKLSTAKANNI